MSLTETIDKQKDRLADKKRKIEMQERLLKEKERKIRSKTINSVIRLAEVSKVTELTSDEILGALLEISERSCDVSNREKWKSRASEFHKSSKASPLIVVPKAEPTKESGKVMKSLGFRWNAFRKEWYGHGNLDEIKKATVSLDAKVEVVT